MTEKLATKCLSCFAIKDPDTGQFVQYTDPRYKALFEQYKNDFSHGYCVDCDKEKRKSKKELSKEVII